MAKRIIWIVLVLVVAGIFYLGYRTYDAGHALSSGEVRQDNVRSYDSSSSNPLPPVITRPPANQTIVYPAPNEPGGSGGSSPSVDTTTPGQSLPPGDTLSPNPPNGMRFSGSGKYQLYRQGNLTYRLDTETGESCIIYATDEEWKRPRVIHDACPKG